MRLVDVRNEERERAISAFVVDDDILVDPGPESAVANLLDALDGWRPPSLLPLPRGGHPAMDRRAREHPTAG